MITGGLGTIKTDELHSYEEAINAKSEAMYLGYGDPKVVKRLMETAQAYPRITESAARTATLTSSAAFTLERMYRAMARGAGRSRIRISSCIRACCSLTTTATRRRAR